MKTGILALALLVAFASALYIGFRSDRQGTEVSFSAPAVTDGGAGLLVGFRMDIKPGSGRLLVDIGGAYYKEDVENSLRKARLVVQREMHADLSGSDVEVQALGGTGAVSGESAGAMFTVALASAVSGRRIRGDAAMSGGVNEDGTLFPVEATPEKINAAIAGGKREFIVAFSQKIPGEIALRRKIRIVRVSTARQAIDAMLEAQGQ